MCAQFLSELFVRLSVCSADVVWWQESSCQHSCCLCMERYCVWYCKVRVWLCQKSLLVTGQQCMKNIAKILKML